MHPENVNQIDKGLIFVKKTKISYFKQLMFICTALLLSLGNQNCCTYKLGGHRAVLNYTQLL